MRRATLSTRVMVPGAGRALRGCVSLAAIAVAALALSPGAQAATVTIGNPSIQPFGSTSVGAPTTLINTALPEPGAILTSPISGTIVRWRIGGASGGPFRLRVMAPGSGLLFSAGQASAPQTPSGTGQQVFPAALSIRAGETIGLETATPSDKVGLTPMPGAGVASWSPPLQPGIGTPANGFQPNVELTLNADVQPEPTVTAVSPNQGPVTGESDVTILGSDFSGATAVGFDTVPALNFSVQNDGRILAVSPPRTKPGPVDITVTTPAGTSGALPPDRFTYTACVVPKLKHRALRPAKRLLRKQECRLGKVRRVRGSGKAARIVRQGERPKTVLPPGARVSVKLG
jgi:IPT/TIG domain